jgi:hypothetical protein
MPLQETLVGTQIYFSVQKIMFKSENKNVKVLWGFVIVYLKCG